jgi:hypothetical protein
LGEDPSSPSPSKEYSNYSITKSNGDSVASGVDSGQLEVEAECSWLQICKRKMIGSGILVVRRESTLFLNTTEEERLQLGA